MFIFQFSTRINQSCIQNFRWLSSITKCLSQLSYRSFLLSQHLTFNTVDTWLEYQLTSLVLLHGMHRCLGKPSVGIILWRFFIAFMDFQDHRAATIRHLPVSSVPSILDKLTFKHLMVGNCFTSVY